MGAIKGLYRTVSSMKAGLILLGAIGLMSGVGSVLLPKSFYQAVYFRILLLLLLLNMTLCTVNQLKKYLRKSKSHQFTVRKIALLILHIGIVLILLGGTIQTFYGEREQIGIIKGDTVEIPWLNSSGSSFSIQLDEFSIEYNPDGSPSQFYSHLSLFEGEEKIKEEIISINHPLKYEGTKVYLLNYGYSIDIEGQSTSGWKNRTTLWEEDSIEISDTERTVKFIKYIPNYDSRYGMRSKTVRPDNPRIIYSVLGGETAKNEVASFEESIEITPEVTIQFNNLHPYAVFIVKSDPGLPLAASGGVMLMAGACIALFFTSSKAKHNRGTL